MRSDRSVRGIAVSVAAVAVATAARAAFDPLLSDSVPFVTYLAAIVVVTLLEGPFWGWVTLGLSALIANYLFIAPRFGLFPTAAENFYKLGVYLIVGCGVVLFAGWVYQRNRRLERITSQLLRSRTQLESALAVSAAGVWDIDLHTGMAEASASIERLYGFTHGPKARSLSEWSAAVHPEDRAEVDRLIAAARVEGRPIEIEHRVLRPDGCMIWVMSRGETITGEDGHRHIVGAMFDITSRKAAELERTLVAEEAQHRARNIFALILSVVANSLVPSEERQRLTARLHALADSFTLTFGPLDRAVSLPLLIEREVKPFDTSRIDASGEAVSIPPTYALGVGLCLHELASNAAKHGALSSPAGRVTIRWEVAQGVLSLRWIETGGPPVAPPTRTGFGTTVITRSISGHGGDVVRDYRPDGLVVRLTLPLS